jgi:hypothetical protein
MENNTKLSPAQKVALDFIASGKSWEQFSMDTFGADSSPPRLATYQALRSRNLIVVGAAGSYVVA